MLSEVGLSEGQSRAVEASLPAFPRRRPTQARNVTACFENARHLHHSRRTIEVVLNKEDGMKSPCAANLHNAVTVSHQRLGKRVAQLSPARMSEMCAPLRFSLGCDSN
jgi:mRNA-degrading endonuclease toxin of MazEF toxin-antitoxin module